MAIACRKSIVIQSTIDITTSKILQYLELIEAYSVFDIYIQELHTRAVQYPIVREGLNTQAEIALTSCDIQ
jgi:hypothetical protein